MLAPNEALAHLIGGTPPTVAPYVTASIKNGRQHQLPAALRIAMSAHTVSSQRVRCWPQYGTPPAAAAAVDALLRCSQRTRTAANEDARATLVESLFAEGKRANRAGLYLDAALCFEHAYLAMPRISYLLSYANMHLKLGESYLAIEIYKRVSAGSASAAAPAGVPYESAVSLLAPLFRGEAAPGTQWQRMAPPSALERQVALRKLKEAQAEANAALEAAGADTPGAARYSQVVEWERRAAEAEERLREQEALAARVSSDALLLNRTVLGASEQLEQIVHALR